MSDTPDNPQSQLPAAPKQQHPTKRQQVLQRRVRRGEVAKLFLRGEVSSRAIAKILGVHNTTVSRDLKYLEQQWHQKMLKRFDKYKAIKLEELAKLKQETYEMLEQSKKSSHQVIVKGEGEDRQVTTIVETQYGDPALARLIKDIIDKEADLLGLKVTKVAATNADGKDAYGPGVMHELMVLAESDGGPEIVDDAYIQRVMAGIAPEVVVNDVLEKPADAEPALELPEIELPEITLPPGDQ